MVSCWNEDPVTSCLVVDSLSFGCFQLLVFIVETCHQLINTLLIGSGLSLEFSNLNILLFDTFLIGDSVSRCRNLPLRTFFVLNQELSLFLFLLILVFPLAGFHLLNDLSLELQRLLSYIVLLCMSLTGIRVEWLQSTNLVLCLLQFLCVCKWGLQVFRNPWAAQSDQIVITFLISRLITWGWRYW